MKENVIKNKSYALRVVNAYQFLCEERREFVMSKLRSGSSIGALICEAEQVESSADFIHKLGITLKG